MKSSLIINLRSVLLCDQLSYLKLVGNRLYRTSAVSRQTPLQPQPISPKVEESSRKSNELVEEDDSKYFKGLSKTINPYWLSNADSVFKQLNWKRLLDPGRKQFLEENFRKRFAEANLDKISKLWKKREECEDEGKKTEITKELVSLALWIPNDTHPEAMAIEDEVPKEIFAFGKDRSAGGDVQEFSKVFGQLN